MMREKAGFSNIGVVLLIAVLMTSLVAGVFAADIQNTPSTQVIVGNAKPTVANVTLNGGSAIDLTPNATTSYNIAYQVSDNNGCADVTIYAGVSGGTSTAYRSGVSATCAIESPTTSSLSCYVFVTRATGTCVGTTFNVTDTVQIWYFAQPTDGTSEFGGDNWLATAFARDLSNETGSANSAGVELNTLLAIRITTSSINYNNGVAMSASSTTGTTNSIATTTNVGNSSSTYTVKATIGLTYSTNNIATSNQRWASSSFNYDSQDPNNDGPNTIRLADAGVNTGQVQLAATTTAGTNGANTFWGLKAPAGTVNGTYTGQNTFTSVAQ